MQVQARSRKNRAQTKKNQETDAGLTVFLNKNKKHSGL